MSMLRRVGGLIRWLLRLGGLDDVTERERRQYRPDRVYLGDKAAYDHFLTGNGLFLVEHYEDAISEFDKAIRIDPEFHAAYGERGIAYLAAGQEQRAIGDFDKAIRIDQYSTYYINRGLSYHYLDQNQQALHDFDEAKKLDPQWNAELYQLRGIIYLELDQNQRAIQDFDEAIRLKPDYGEAFAMRAVVHTVLNMDLEAAEDIDQAVELGYDARDQKKAIEELKAER